MGYYFPGYRFRQLHIYTFVLTAKIDSVSIFFLAKLVMILAILTGVLGALAVFLLVVLVKTRKGS